MHVLFEKIVIRGNAHAAIHLRMINQFLELALFYVNNSQYIKNKIYSML